MINEVVNQWLKVLDPLKQATLITAVYGLVRPGRIRLQNERDFVIPVLLDAKDDTVFETVDDGLFLNSKQRAVVFVQGDSTKTIKTVKGNTKIESFPVRLVLWYNKEGYQTEGGNVASKLVATVAALLNQPQQGVFGGFQNVTFERSGIIAGWRCFQEYTFREETGYLFEPYESVGIAGNLTFYLNEDINCLSDLLSIPFITNC